jgi:DNA polymerase-3 subunit alpha
MPLAQKYAEYFYDLFDGNFALELQIHPEYQDQYIINEGIVELSEKLDFPIVVTCDCHFTNENDKPLRKIIKAIGWKKMINDPNLHDSLKSNCIGNSDLIHTWAQECNFIHTDVLNIAIKNTNYIANMCNAQLEEPQRRIPIFDKHQEYLTLFNGVEW